MLTALSAMFVEEIFRATGARRRGAKTDGGAITFVQRFGGSLNLNVHFHVVVLDGTFERTVSGARFRESPPPPQDAIERVARRVHDRALKWLRRRLSIASGSVAPVLAKSLRPHREPKPCSVS